MRQSQNSVYKVLVISWCLHGPGELQGTGICAVPGSGLGGAGVAVCAQWVPGPGALKQASAGSPCSLPACLLSRLPAPFRMASAGVAHLTSFSS